MIKKLRMKFIGIFMGSLVLVLALLMGLLNFFNYQGMVNSADMLLDVLAENDGAFPKPQAPEKIPEGLPAEFFGYLDFSPETPYETRFFVVRLNENGQAETVDTGKIAAVDKETAVSYGEKAWGKGTVRGFISQYRYRQKETEKGCLIVFLDGSRLIGTAKSVLLTSMGVSMFGIFLVFILILVLSGRVMKPVYESNEKQRRFITDAGHEIKTPLTIINADMDVLGMEIGDNEWLEDIRKQTQRLTVLTNDLIYLARMEEENKQIQMIELPFSDLVEETAQSFQAVAIVERKNFSLKITPMLMLKGDEKALRKLVTILLDNAVKYSNENGNISVNLEKTGRMVKLSVTNTVEGISKETLSHLFERFYRADTSRNSRKSGYGIGLSIAEAIVLAHRGEIKASSKDGKILNMTVLLPVKERNKEKSE